MIVSTKFADQFAAQLDSTNFIIMTRIYKFKRKAYLLSFTAVSLLYLAAIMSGAVLFLAFLPVTRDRHHRLCSDGGQRE
jgi:hypothetical protein